MSDKSKMVMQEQDIEALVDARIQVALSKLQSAVLAPLPTTDDIPFDKSKTVIQERASRDRYKLMPHQVRAMRDKRHRDVSSRH